MKKESNAMKKLILMSLFILPVAACGEQTTEQSSTQTQTEAQAPVQEGQSRSVSAEIPRSDLCISSPLIDVGEDTEVLGSGQNSFPVQMYGFALGQKVDHLKPCAVDAWGLPAGWTSFYGSELCYWENKGAIEVTRGLLLSTPYKGAIYPASDTYKDRVGVCGTGLNLGLDENRRIAYMTIRTAGLKDQEYIFDWFKQQLGEPEIYAVVDSSKTQQDIRNEGAPREIVNFWGKTNGGIIAIWKVNGIWVRFVGEVSGYGMLDLGYDEVLEQGGDLAKWDIRER